MRILFVCTANICRSASAAHLLREALAGRPGLLAGVEVRSAGTAAMAGSPGCSVAPALVGLAAEHRSQPLTADLVAWADLILPAARDHRPAILDLDPRARTRTFTIRQAGRIADWMVEAGMVGAAQERAATEAAETGVAGAHAARDAAVRTAPVPERPQAISGASSWAGRFPVGDPRCDVEALPLDPADRWQWIVREMDAARGLPGAPRLDEVGSVPVEVGRRSWRDRASRSKGAAQSVHSVPGASQRPGGSARGGADPDPNEVHPDDVPDPHFLGMGLHALAYEQIASSTGALARLLREVASAP